MEIQKYIDHTLLKADASQEEIDKICQEAREYGFMSVCVNLGFAQRVSKNLEGTEVKTCVVVGFPLGATNSEVKAFETREAIKAGATEVDMVINISKLKDQDYDYVLKDIRAVVEEAKGKALVKVIIESCLLTDEEKIKVCQLAVEAGADYVKTSTGFSTGGATVEDVKLMKETVKDQALVKASGGIRDYQTAMAMIEAGASRIGASAGIKIVEDSRK